MNYSELWFNTATGELVNDEDGVLEASEHHDPNLRPLPDLIFGEDFPYERGDYQRMSAKDTSIEDAIIAGRGIAKIFLTYQGLQPMHRHHVDRLNILGLLPDYNFINTRFGKLSTYCETIGVGKARDSTRFNKLSKSELIKLILQEHEKVSPDYPITKKELYFHTANGTLPDHQYITRNVSSISELNEMLGYPDTKSWEISDFIDYGVRVLKVNGSDALQYRYLQQLSQRGLGPAMTAINNRFGSLNTFVRLSLAEFEHQQKLEATRAAAIERHFNEVDYADQTPKDPSLKAHVWAKYHVAQDCLPGHDDSTLIRLALLPNGEFIKGLIAEKRGLTVADIEISALSLQVTDDIWAPRYMREPKITR